MRIAMWSGPRNLSTAMMYSFASRSDCQVWDEPYYAAYLKSTGLVHPMQKEILKSWLHDAAEIALRCSGSIPNAKTLFYQKHMTHHMIPEFDTGWMKEVINVFLIRHPARVLASYDQKREAPSLQDIGFQRQLELFDQVAENTGVPPIVIDSFDIRQQPKKMLRKLCDVLGLNWDAKMLSWSKGGNKDDGPWAQHWYNAAWNSSGFSGAEKELPSLNSELSSVCDAATPIYEALSKYKFFCDAN